VQHLSTTATFKPRRILLSSSPCPFERDTLHAHQGVRHISTHIQGVPLTGYYAQTARMASSNTFLRPFCVSAEHSRNLTALISFAIATPCWYVSGCMRLYGNVRMNGISQSFNCPSVEAQFNRSEWTICAGMGQRMGRYWWRCGRGTKPHQASQ